MIDLHNRWEGPGELEALIHSSGDLVQVSEDLRPRVLEAAHVSSQRRSYEVLLQQVAMLLLLIGATSALVMDRWHDHALSNPDVGSHRPETKAVPSQGLATPGNHSWSDDPGWQLVESFAETRRRQAELLPRGA